MEVDEFWNIVESSKARSEGSHDRHAELLAEHLSALSPVASVVSNAKSRPSRASSRTRFITSFSSAQGRYGLNGLLQYPIRDR
jgi:Protein of unknown function (DUF4240)